ncbi:QueT transporter family protein [Oscillibacter sp. MSJ-2]|uniref:QueT transporter family protein n=1 Tax=Dysosmobacter acutus TaxID=2841504 RepID=A0ABS6F789_9FIRM|nr:QueT transporter family protein [Dysosmobacter acutus]MBU5626149.1 QueT transporter family protein [Dysosmobacter acutus]
MSKSRFTVQQITFAAVVAAAYAVLSYFAALFSVAYGPIQCRFSEALCVLPFFFPAATPGLFIGCLIANLLSPYGALDIIFGSLATLLAAVLTSRCRQKWLAPLPPVLCNALIVGAVIAFQQTSGGGSFAAAFLYNAATVGLGELISCYVLGSALLGVLPRIHGLAPYMRPQGQK